MGKFLLYSDAGDEKNAPDTNCQGRKNTRYHPNSVHGHPWALTASNKDSTCNGITRPPLLHGGSGRQLRVQYTHRDIHRFAPPIGSLKDLDCVFFPSSPFTW